MPFVMDADGDIEPGDYLRSEHGSWYRVHTARDVRRRDPAATRPRAAASASPSTRLNPPPAAVENDARVHEFVRRRR